MLRLTLVYQAVNHRRLSGNSRAYHGAADGEHTTCLGIGINTMGRVCEDADMRAKEIFETEIGEQFQNQLNHPRHVVSTECGVGRKSLRMVVTAIMDVEGDTFETVDIVERVDYNIDTVRRNLDEIEENGFIERERRPPKAIKWTKGEVFDWEPHPSSDQ